MNEKCGLQRRMTKGTYSGQRKALSLYYLGMYYLGTYTLLLKYTEKNNYSLVAIPSVEVVKTIAGSF